MRARVAVVLIVCVVVALVVRRFLNEPAPAGTAPDLAEPVAALRKAFETIRLSEGRATTADSTEAAFVLEGRVVSTANGEGIVDATVELGGAGALFEVITKADGSFIWSTPTAGNYQLTSIIATGFVSFAPELGHSPIVFTARTGVRLHDVTLYLTPGKDPAPRAVPDGPSGSIAGRVVDEQGNGVAGALVTARSRDGEQSAESDGDGRFLIGELLVGKYNVRATHPERVADEKRGIAVGTSNLSLVLKSGGSVSGQVRDAETQKPIVAFTLVAMDRLGAIQRGEQKSMSFFDEQGRFTMTGVRAGTQCLTALASGRSASKEQCVSITVGGEAHADFTLARGAKLSGRVLDRDTHTPIVKARVSLESAFETDSRSPIPVVSSAETDDRGQFELSGLDTGVRSLFVKADGHHSRVLPGIQLDADRPPAPLDIDLQATAQGEAAKIESAGINAAVRSEGDVLIINGVTPNGGAAQAGLQAGDVLVRVDGIELNTLSLQAGVEHLRGPEGSTVTVTMRRPPDPTTRDVVVTRRRVINP